VWVFKTCKPICVICIWFCIVSIDPTLVFLPTSKYAKKCPLFRLRRYGNPTPRPPYRSPASCDSAVSKLVLCCCNWTDGQTDGRTDTVTLHRPCSAYYGAVPIKRWCRITWRKRFICACNSCGCQLFESTKSHRGGRHLGRHLEHINGDVKFAWKVRKCAETIGTVPVPWAGHFQC